MKKKTSINTYIGGLFIKTRTHKRVVILVAVILVLVLCVLAAYLSRISWGQFSNNYNNHLGSIKSEVDSVILQTTTKKTVVGSTDKLARISQTQSKITNEIDSFCDITPLIKWQSFIHQYSDKLNDCDRKKVYLRQLSSDLGILITFVNAEQSLATIFNAANQNTAKYNQPDKWGLIEPFWRKAATDIKGLLDNTQFNQVKTLSSDSATKVAVAWKELALANNNKDRSKFEQAKSDMTSAYAKIATISSVATKEIDVLIANLGISYDKLY